MSALGEVGAGGAQSSTAAETRQGLIWRVISALASLPLRMRRITTTGAYKPEIDGLRFFAISIVLLGHLGERVQRAWQVEETSGIIGAAFMWATIPGIGVSLFFTISGFIVASQFLTHGRNVLSGTVLKKYFVRRVTRIEPPYIVLLLVTFAALSLTHFQPPGVHRFWGEPKSLTTSLFASLAYSHGWLFGNPPRLVGQGWSLEIEIQFYLIAPLLLAAYGLVRSVTPRLWFGLATLCVSIAAASFTPERLGPVHMYYTLAPCFPFFWVGILLADANRSFPRMWERISPAVGGTIGWLSMLGLFATGLYEGREPRMLIVITTLSVVSIVGVFAGALSQGAFRRFCSLSWISLLGGACYSIYLTHLQLTQLATFALRKILGDLPPLTALGLNLALQVPVIFAFGLLTYLLLERPFMKPDWPAAVLGFLRRPFTGAATLPRPKSGHQGRHG